MLGSQRTHKAVVIYMLLIVLLEEGYVKAGDRSNAQADRHDAKTEKQPKWTQRRHDAKTDGRPNDHHNSNEDATLEGKHGVK